MSRTREFDVDTAVDAALRVFWRKGYEGTTLTDLTEALGINRPSLYGAFESKEGLFLRALERYLTGPGAAIGMALEADVPAREIVTRILRFYADAAGQPERPAGCLLVQGALACGDGAVTVQSALADKRHFAEAALASRLEQAKRGGELPSDAKPADLARYVWSVCFGMAVQAAGGASRAQLRSVAQLALRAWPSS